MAHAELAELTRAKDFERTRDSQLALEGWETAVRYEEGCQLAWRMDEAWKTSENSGLLHVPLLAHDLALLEFRILRRGQRKAQRDLLQNQRRSARKWREIERSCPKKKRSCPENKRNCPESKGNCLETVTPCHDDKNNVKDDELYRNHDSMDGSYRSQFRTAVDLNITDHDRISGDKTYCLDPISVDVACTKSSSSCDSTESGGQERDLQAVENGILSTFCSSTPLCTQFVSSKQKNFIRLEEEKVVLEGGEKGAAGAKENGPSTENRVEKLLHSLINSKLVDERLLGEQTAEII